MIYRDGRFLKERKVIQGYAKSRHDDVLEVVKKPRVILYRCAQGEVMPCKLGDSFTLPDDSLAVQSQNYRSGGYPGPLKLMKISGDAISDDDLQEFIALLVLPTLSLTNTPRLPVPIYWADLISKLDAAKWAKAVGRGFGLRWNF